MVMRLIIVAPYQMHKNLLKKYRQKEAFLDVKTISKEELLGQYYGRIEESAISYLMKKYQYSYDNISAILPYIPYVDKEPNNLFEIKEDLLKEHLLIRNEYLKQFFKNNEVLVYGYSNNDRELKTVLDINEANYRFFLNEKNEEEKDLDVFETQFDEVFFTLNSIAGLLDKGIDINKIFIYTVNREYLYPLMEFSQGFGFTIDDGKSHSLFVTPLAKTFLDNLSSSKDFNLAKESVMDCEDKGLLEDLLQVVDKCHDEEMSFDMQLDYLIGELKTTSISRNNLKDVVKIINRPIYDEDAYIFVMGLAQGSYPKSKKDNDLVSDIHKKEMGLNSSLEETQINRDVLLDFFYSKNHFFYSFSERSISNKYFISPLAEELNLKKKKHELPNIIYSRDMVDYYFAKLKDLKEFYKEAGSDYHALEQISNIPYGEYDNSFKGVNALDENVEIRHSYSKINDYYQCPFRYYIGNILGIDPFEGNFATKFGGIAHKIFELHNNPDFDFNKVFDEEVSKQEFLPEELPIIANLKVQIKRASEAVRLHQKYMNNPKFITEKKLGMDIGKKSYLSGVIDKSIIFDDKYLVLVDYKTGNDSFDSNYISQGVSLQLPTYCLLAKKDDAFKDYTIIGIFINNVVNTKLTYGVDEEALIDPYFRLNGKVTADIDLIGQIDKTIYNGKSEFIKSVSITKEGRFAKSNSLVSPSEFDEYAEIALRKYLEADANIRNNNFIINPLFKSKSDNACKYCEYRDICYVKKNQRRYLYDPKDDDEEDESNE